MEMTIARDRWQQHLKTRGDHYLGLARQLTALHGSHPDVGADVSALALECLAGVLEACRVGRLTRNQHVLLRLGELIAQAEGAASLVRRAAAAADGSLPDKGDRRFAPDVLAVISRVCAREAALKVAEEGVRWVCGAAAPGSAVPLADDLPLLRVRAAQAGLLADMDQLADALYDRVTPDRSQDRP
jgi:hypothetical protein